MGGLDQIPSREFILLEYLFNILQIEAECSLKAKYTNLDDNAKII